MGHREKRSFIKAKQIENREDSRFDENKQLQIGQCGHKKEHIEHQQSEDHYSNLRGIEKIQKYQSNSRQVANLRGIIFIRK